MTYKKIYINNKVYDTEAATLVAAWPDDPDRPIPNNTAEERLYRKTNGEFFLYGVLKDALVINGRRYDGERIIPLTSNEAGEWVRERVPECYGDIFGAAPEDAGSRRN